MSALRVLINGATGKMGTQILDALSQEKDLEPVGGICRNPQSDYLTLQRSPFRIPLSNDLDKLVRLTAAQVLVDVSIASACMAAVSVAAHHGVHLVIGTSGLSENKLQEIDKLAREGDIGALLVPNFALGAVLLTHLAKQVAPFFEYVDIIETHHEAKNDAPSGTSIALAQALTSSGKVFTRNIAKKESLTGARGGDYRGVNIHSRRLPGRLAHHEVTFGISGQTLTLRHDTINRECYMAGALLAIREVPKMRGLVQGLEGIMGLE